MFKVENKYIWLTHFMSLVSFYIPWKHRAALVSQVHLRPWKNYSLKKIFNKFLYEMFDKFLYKSECCK